MRKSIGLLILFILPLVVNAQNPYYYFTQGTREGSHTPYGNNLSVGKYLQAGDVKLWYEVYGSGKPLFVFHGGGVGSPYEMAALIDSLRSLNRYQVFVFSTRGHGRSELGKEKMSLEQRAKDFSIAIRTLTHEKVSILGFSDGAYSAMSLAVYHPELVERVVAIGAGTIKAGYMSAGATISDWERLDKRFVDQQKKIMPEPNRWQEFLTDYMTYWSKLDLGKDFFSKIACPLLFVVGDEDDHAPVQTVVDAYFMTPNSQLCVIPKAWHTCFLDNFMATWASIKPFIHTDIN